jgi:hypothetical protein
MGLLGWDGCKIGGSAPTAIAQTRSAVQTHGNVTGSGLIGASIVNGMSMPPITKVWKRL